MTVTERERQYRQTLAAAAPSADSAFSLPGFNAAVRDGGDACIGWPNITAPQPVRAKGALPNVPVLVLSGDLDAISPDAHGEQVAARFADATFVSVPNTGHVPDLEPSGCVTGIVDRFIRTGTTGSTTCVESVPPIVMEPVIG